MFLTQLTEHSFAHTD